MTKLIIKKARIKINHHRRNKKEAFKKEAYEKNKQIEHKRVCPNCGNSFDEGNGFIVQKKLFGQRSKCNRCGYTFKDPFTEIVKTKQGVFRREKP
jgi:transposase-like protein